MPVDSDSLKTLKNIVEQVDLLISTTEPMPENRTARCRELLKSAMALTTDLLKQAGKSSARVA